MNVVVSLIFVLVGIYCCVSFIPAHDPARVKSTELLMSQLRGEARWPLKKEVVSPLYLGALVMIVLGGLSLLTGSFKTVGKLAFCRGCDCQVVALGWRCERCDKSV